VALLSLVQCASYDPDPTKVERVRTKWHLFNIFWSVLYVAMACEKAIETMDIVLEDVVVVDRDGGDGLEPQL